MKGAKNRLDKRLKYTIIHTSTKGAPPMNSNVITFDSTAKRFILDIFDIAIDAEGYLVEKNNPKQRVLSNGEDVREEDFAGVENGSIVILKSDLPSLIDLSDRLK